MVPTMVPVTSVGGLYCPSWEHTSLGQQHQRPRGERCMKTVTIMEGAAEVGQLGQNPDLQEIETAQASCEGTAHIVGGGGGVNGNAPPKKQLALVSFLDITLLFFANSIKNGESGRGRTGHQGMPLQKISAIALMAIVRACIAAAATILHGSDGLDGSSQEGQWHPFAVFP